MKVENISTLKINRLTQAQYDREKTNDNLDENALYLTEGSAEDGSAIAIIDVDSLPTENINEDLIYRVKEVGCYTLFNGEKNSINGTPVMVYVVDTLPEVGEAFTNSASYPDFLKHYFQTSDRKPYLYESSALGGRGWVSKDGQVVSTPEEATEANVLYYVTSDKYTLYFYNGREWEKYQKEDAVDFVAARVTNIENEVSMGYEGFTIPKRNNLGGLFVPTNAILAPFSVVNKKYVDNSIANVSISDYNENDSTKKSYIANRPFYEDGVVEHTTGTKDIDLYNYFAIITPTVGEQATKGGFGCCQTGEVPSLNDVLQYTLIWQDTDNSSGTPVVTEHTELVSDMTRTDVSGGYDFGKLMLLITDYTAFNEAYSTELTSNGIYLVKYDMDNINPDTNLQYADTYEATSFKAPNIVKLDEKFIPDTIARKSDIPTGGSGGSGTTVTVNGVAQESWNADSKIDAPTDSSITVGVYARDGLGKTVITPIKVIPTVAESSIVQRVYDGSIIIRPEFITGDWTAVNKKYVDEAVASAGSGGGKLYKHYMTIEKAYTDSSTNVTTVIQACLTEYSTKDSESYSLNTIASKFNGNYAVVGLAGTVNSDGTSNFAQLVYVAIANGIIMAGFIDNSQPDGLGGVTINVDVAGLEGITDTVTEV